MKFSKNNYKLSTDFRKHNINNSNVMSKTLKTLTLSLVAMLFFACGNDDDNEPSTMKIITAERWYLESSNIVTMDDCNRNTWFQFYENGNLVGESYGLDGDENCVNTLLLSGTWELLSDTEFTTTSDGETTLFTIISISESEFMFSSGVGDEAFIQILDKSPGNG